jgi:hypothetical protein
MVVRRRQEPSSLQKSTLTGVPFVLSYVLYRGPANCRALFPAPSRILSSDSNPKFGIGISLLQLAVLSGYGFKDLRARHSSTVVSHVSEGRRPET